MVLSFRSSTRAWATAATWSTWATTGPGGRPVPGPARPRFHRGPARAARGRCSRHPPARRLPLRCHPAGRPRRCGGVRLGGRRAAVSAYRAGDGDEVDLGGLTLRAWSTPGHTGEHIAYLLADGDTVLGVFTGGSLLVGAAARTDLVDPGADRAAGPRPVRLAAPAGDAARRHGGVADARCRIVLLSATGSGADHHHRPGEGHQSAARRRERGRLRRSAARRTRLLPAVLPAAGRGQPAWSVPAARPTAACRRWLPSR